ALQKLSEVKTLVIDKTGTLTEGKPSVVSVKVEGVEEERLIQLAASVETASEHPLGQAVVALAKKRGIVVLAQGSVAVVPGQGISASVDSVRVAVGSAEFLKENGTGDCALFNDAAGMEREGRTVIFVALDGRCAGLLAVADPVRASAPEALRQLR